MTATGNRLKSPLLALALLASFILVDGSPSFASSQNEFLISVSFDGTAIFDNDSLDDTATYPSPHTPGLDERDDNGVVRSYDSIGIRLDWNINESSATNVVLEATLPAEVAWTPHPQTNPAEPYLFPGCLSAVDGVTPESSISADGRTLICNLGDKSEGSNGTIFAEAAVGGLNDGTLIPVTGKLRTDDDATGVVDSLDDSLVVSAAPSGDWQKGTPEVIDAIDNGGVDGDILIFPLTFEWNAGTQGSEPMNDATGIQFFDHAWDLPNAVFAEALMPAGRTACGQFDGSGPLASTGDWSCQLIASGHEVVQVEITNHDTAGKNGVVSLHGQIAFWVPQTDLDARWALDTPRNTMYNSITGAAGDSWAGFDKGDPAADPVVLPDDPADLITPILVSGTNSSSAEDVNNNTAGYSDQPLPDPVPDTGTGTGTPRRVATHTVDIVNAPYQQIVFPDDTGRSFTSFDRRAASVGGVSVAGEEPHARSLGEAQAISRGETFTISATFSTQANSGDSSLDPIHGCVALDSSAYDLVPFDSIDEYTVTSIGGQITNRPSSSHQVIQASDGPLAHVVTGTDAMIKFTMRSGTDWTPTGAASGEALDYLVEFGLGPSAATGSEGHDMGEDAVSCNDSDAVSWVAAAAVQEADYDQISRVRVINNSRVLWAGAASTGSVPGSPSPNHYDTGPVVTLNLQAKVKDGPSEELFVWASRGMGDWDSGAGKPGGVFYEFSGLGTVTEASCVVFGDNTTTIGRWTDLEPDTDLGTNTTTTTTGWCNEPYADSGDATAFSRQSMGQIGSAFRAQEYHADKRYIESSRPAVEMTNSSGGSDFADNGDLVRFVIEPSIFGASDEALTNVRLVNDLSATNYEFVQFVSRPSTGTGCVEDANVITCQFSEPDPAIDSDASLPAGLPGGWTDRFEIEVRLVSGEATSAAAWNGNTVEIHSSGSGPWDNGFTGAVDAVDQTRDGSAGSSMPPPEFGTFIAKAVATHDGSCDRHPTESTPPAGWADSCSQIGLDENMQFSLTVTNDGNASMTDVAIVDVFPHLADEVEAASDTSVNGVAVPTAGDGRAAQSDFSGSIDFVSLTGPDGTVVWVTGDDPAGVSRDPDKAMVDTTWCDAAGGAIQNPTNNGSGACPATNADVTATYAYWGEILRPGQSVTQTLTLDSDGSMCDDIWTNSFGARTSEILLPVRSNDVSVMAGCDFDLALEKTVADSWTPDGDWMNPGSSTVDFEIEVTNQGDPIMAFDVTDYVTDAFTFEVANNAAGTTGGDRSLTYSWDDTSAATPVVSVTGSLLEGESVTIPVTLTLAADWNGEALESFAEVSRFDSDGDPANGDSNPANTSNPSAGALVDVDSTPDGTNNESGDAKLEDGQIDESPSTGDTSLDGTVDEDDHDVAVVPLWDLELIKTLRTGVVDTSTTPWSVSFDITVNNQGNQSVFDIDVTEYGANGLTYNPTASAALWTAEAVTGVTDASPTFTIAGPVGPGETVTFPLVFDVTDLSLAPYENGAEISGFDDDGDAGNAANPLASDIDSTPDDTNDDDVIDQIQNNYDPDNDDNLNEVTVGDEDDHDVAVVEEPNFSVGNEVWLDADYDGIRDDDESPIPGVTVDLFSDNDGDGQPDDANDDGIVDADDRIGRVLTSSAGGYLFSGLQPGSYVVGIHPSNWDSGRALENLLSAGATSTDPNDDVDDDDNGTPGLSGYVWSGAVEIDGSEPTDEPGLSNDPSTVDSMSNLTVDFGFWKPVMDLALSLVLLGDEDTFSPGDLVTYSVEVINQGNVAVTDVVIVNTLPAGLELATSDAASLGVIQGAAAVVSGWTYLGDNRASISIDDLIMPGATARVTITARVLAGDGTELVNLAEITEAVAVTNDRTPLIYPNGEPVQDIDSSLDALRTGASSAGDEDDNDIAVIKRPTPASNVTTQGTDKPSSVLAYTGMNVSTLLFVSLLLMSAGLVLVWTRRRVQLEVAD